MHRCWWLYVFDKHGDITYQRSYRWRSCAYAVLESFGAPKHRAGVNRGWSIPHGFIEWLELNAPQGQ